MHDVRDALTPLEAAALLRDMDRVDEKLKRRVHGLTWLLWGVITPGIFLTFSFAAYVIRDNVWGDQPAWIGLLWMPWSFVGLLATLLLWRSVGFVARDLGLRLKAVLLHVTLFVASTVGLVGVMLTFDAPLYPPVIVLFGLGIATGSLGAHEMATGRRVVGGVQVAMGLLFIGVAVLQATLFPGPPDYVGMYRASMLNAVVTAIGFLTIGTVRSLHA